MNYQAIKAAIADEVEVFCLNRAGTWADGASLFWQQNPEKAAEFDMAAAAVARQVLPAQFQKDANDAALEDDEDSRAWSQLNLFGVPPIRLSPLVEVAPGDWRKSGDFTVPQDVAFRRQLAEKHRRRARYQDATADDNEVGLVAVEARIPDAKSLTGRELENRWLQIGLFEVAHA